MSRTLIRLVIALVLVAVSVAVSGCSLWWREHQATVAQDARSVLGQFAQVYTLEPGRAVKRIEKPALVGGRSEFLVRHGISPDLLTDVAVTFGWNDTGLELQGMDYGSHTRPRTLARVLTNSLHLPSYIVAYDYHVGEIELLGDWIVREDATVEEVLKDLEHIVESATGEAIQFVKRRMERSLIHVRGIYDAERVQSQGGQLDIFDTQKTSGPHAGGRGTLEGMLRWLGNLFDGAIVDDSVGAEHASVSWANHIAKESYTPAEIARVLENLSDQTGLTFEANQRQTDVWYAIRR